MQFNYSWGTCDWDGMEGEVVWKREERGESERMRAINKKREKLFKRNDSKVEILFTMHRTFAR